MPKAATIEKPNPCPSIVGCEHNAQRIIEYPPKVRVTDGDYLVLRCPEGCIPIYISIGKRKAKS